MSGIKYYTIRDGEELPDEFAVVENVGGEPEIRAWYSKNDQLTAENAKLRELVKEAYACIESVSGSSSSSACASWEWRWTDDTAPLQMVR